jgi:pyruvate formate lyase activating enzyme
MSTEAKWYVTNKEEVQCTLCPHFCKLSPGKTGLCKVRHNVGGKLITDAYGYIAAENLDPIEKKPLYHFMPGSEIYSIGTYGCNMRCFFCQNCSISQTNYDPYLPRHECTPEQIVKLALEKPGNTGIAFTYNEPVVWFEYMYDIAKLAKEAGLKTVMVTNGFINKEPLEELIPLIDAFSVDLKSFSEEFYSKVTSSTLEPVKESLKLIRKSGKHLEIVNLIIPDLNDDDPSFTAMVKWIAAELGKQTVFHISRYFPFHKLTTAATNAVTMRRLLRIAGKELSYVYTGNMQDENNNTNCAECNNVLIYRKSYQVDTSGIDKDGNCKVCGNNFLKKT